MLLWYFCYWLDCCNDIRRGPLKMWQCAFDSISDKLLTDLNNVWTRKAGPKQPLHARWSAQRACTSRLLQLLRTLHSGSIVPFVLVTLLKLEGDTADTDIVRLFVSP